MAKERKKNKQKNLNNKPDKTKSISLLAMSLRLIPVLVILGGFYAYQYAMRPEIKFEDISAYVSEIDKNDMAHIHFNFKLKNDGKSKTKDSILYTAFIDWEGSIKNGKPAIAVKPTDFTKTDMFALGGGNTDNFEMEKYVKDEFLVKFTNTAGGFYCVVVCQWGSDNLAHFGRTFSNNELLFMKPFIRDNKMAFVLRRLEQRYSTKWFLKDKRPDIFELLKLLPLEEIVYGDTARSLKY